MVQVPDHLDCVPKPGRFPLILNPLVGMTRLTKALMDGGSDLNLMYLDSFEGLGLGKDRLKTSPPFMLIKHQFHTPCRVYV
jgi:hypothetical protein